MTLTEQQIKNFIAGAPSLQAALQQLYCQAPRSDEEDFFCAVMYHLGNTGKCRVFKTHKHPVVNVRSGVSCEISDLLLIAYSPKRTAMKINFLQAKLVPFNDNKQGRIHVNGEDYFKFHFDGTQYRLLKDCPIIQPKQTGLPANILSDAISDSITSYGVFYKNGNDIEMTYEITQLLKPHNISKIHANSNDRISYFDTIENKYGVNLRKNCCCHPHPWYYECCCRHWHSLDLLSTLSADTFEKSLFDFQVGSPMCGQVAIDFVQAISTNFLKKEDTKDFDSFIKEAILLWNEQEYIYRRYLEHENRGNDNIGEDKHHDFGDIEDLSAAPKYILLINVDSERNKRE